MNLVKIQFKNGLIKEYKTPFNSPAYDNLETLNSALFRKYTHLDTRVSDCNDLEKFYTGLNKEKTVRYLGAKILEFYKIDGRTRFAKKLKYYTHKFLFENYN